MFFMKAFVLSLNKRKPDTTIKLPSSTKYRL